jgi:SAM-dependent methyltransferase
MAIVRNVTDRLVLARDLLLGKKRPHRGPTARELREDQMEARIERRVMRRIGGAISRTHPAGPPNLDAIAVALREMGNMQWDIKVLGSALAEHLYCADLPRGPLPDAPGPVKLTSKLCVQADIRQPWFRYWAAQIRQAPLYHRKVWEDAFVLQALWEREAIRPGCKGIGFAVGAEALPAYLAGQGVEVLATDLDAADARSQAWSITHQHASSLEQLHRAALVDRDLFDLHCRYEPIDMNAIPARLHGQFDFCWSVCALEHLGSIEQGLCFIERSVDCLRPGGIAVHTTEFNLELTGETVDNWITVLFQRRHIEALAERLARNGHTLEAVDYDAGSGVLDGFVDLPPFGAASHMRHPSSPHLRVSVEGFAATSIGLIIRAAA